MTPAQDLIRHYRWLRRAGINDSHSGNMSVRNGERIWVTPSGACADTLRPEQLIECRLDAPPPPGASLDAALHLDVFRCRASAGCVIHSHGPYTVAMTLDGHDFEPPDFEGHLYFPTVPVVSIDYDRYLAESPARVAAVLAARPIMVVRGHGVYACAETVNLAYKWTCSLEHSAHTAYLARRAGTWIG